MCKLFGGGPVRRVHQPCPPAGYYNPCPPSYVSYPSYGSYPPAVHARLPEPPPPARPLPASNDEYQELRQAALTKALGSKSYASMLDEIRQNMLGRYWAKSEDAQAIHFQAKAAAPDQRGTFNREITFDIPANPCTPDIKTLRFGRDERGSPYRAEWRYRTGADNLVRIWGGEWQLDIKRVNGRDHYTIRTKHDFVGAIKLDIDGKSYLVYTHPQDEQPKKTPPLNSDSPPAPPPAPSPSDERLSLPPKLPGATRPGDDLRAGQLDQRERKLDQREDELERRARELDQKAADLAAKEQQQAKERERLAGWDKALGERQSAIESTEQRLSAREDQLNGLRGELTRQRAQQQEEDKRLKALAEGLNGREKAVAAAEQQNQARARELEAQRKQQQQTETSLAAQKRDLDALAARLAADGTDLQKQTTALGERQRELNEQSAGLAKQREQLEKAKRDLEALQTGFAKDQKDLTAEHERLTTLRADLETTAGRQSADYERRKQELDEQEKQLRTREEAAAAAMKEAKDQLAGLKEREAKLDQSAETIRDLQAKLERAQAGLAARTGELVKMQGELFALRADLEKKAREKETQEAKGPEQLAVTDRPAPERYTRPALDWSTVAPETDERQGPGRRTEVPLPSWVRLVTGAHFDEMKFEQLTPGRSYEEFLAGGNYDRRETISENLYRLRTRIENKEATQDEIKEYEAFEAGERWYQRNVDRGYSPILKALSGLENFSDFMARTSERRGEWDKWSDDERSEARERLDYVLREFDTAVKGAIPGPAEKEGEDPPHPTEDLDGLGEKISAVRTKVEALREKSSRTTDENGQLQYLEDVLYRYEMFQRWYDNLSPHVERLRAAKDGDLAAAFNKEIEAPKVEPAAPLSSVMPTFETAIGDPETAPDLKKAREGFARLAAVKAQTPAKVRELLGDEPSLAAIERNIDAVSDMVQDRRWQQSEQHRRVQTVRDEVFAILSKKGTVEERTQALEEFCTTRLGRNPFGSTLKTSVENFLAAPDQDGRSAVFWSLMQPFTEKIEADFLAERTALQKDLEAARKVVRDGRGVLRAAALSKKSDELYERFTGSEIFNSYLYGLSDDKVAELKPAVRDDATAVLAALRDEEALLKPLVGSAEVKDSPIRVRYEQVLRRKANVEQWLKDNE